MKSIIVWSSLALLLAACNTVHGIKEDAKQGGEAVGQSLKKAGQAVGNAVEKGGQAIQNATQ